MLCVVFVTIDCKIQEILYIICLDVLQIKIHKLPTYEDIATIHNYGESKQDK